MAKIVLIWNNHPGESPVTLPMARKLKVKLEKKGHEVRIEKVPFKSTLYGFDQKTVQDFLSLTKKVRKQVASKFPDHFIIDLHTTPDKILEAPRRISKWRMQTLGVGLEEPKKRPLLEKQGTRIYFLEMPAAYRDASPGLKSIEKKRATLAFWRHKIYYLKQADLKASKAANYLSPLAVRKFAHVIDTAVNTDLGIYRKPRRPPFKKKPKSKRSRRGKR